VQARIVLVGTYKGNQLENWPTWYCWPLDAEEAPPKATNDIPHKDADAHREREEKLRVSVSLCEIIPDWLPRITELWLFQGNKAQKTYKAEFVGVKTRTELVRDYGYPATGKAHGQRYALFRTEILYRHKNAPQEEVEAVIIRTKDFAKRSPKITRQLIAYLESPERSDPALAKLLPSVITSLAPERLRVCESGVQMMLWNWFETESTKKKRLIDTGLLMRGTTTSPIGTVGRNRAREATPITYRLVGEKLALYCGDSLDCYQYWPAPDVIVSDGAYGILGFEGDTIDHTGVPEWYRTHIEAWSAVAKPSTTLWFWNSEIGWAAAHPVLEANGWRYQNCNIWDKGLAHIAGNVNTTKIRRFPVVSEVCVQYVRDVSINGDPLKVWLKKEWQRTGLPLRCANEACGVVDAAVRKYLDQGHLWYFPPPEMFEKLQEFANEHGKPEGRPYFSLDGKTLLSGKEWGRMRSKFYCPHGRTNVWSRPPVNGHERIKNEQGKALHLNQKPLDLMTMIIKASSEEGDVVWEPFGGLFTACRAALDIGRKAFGCEINPYYFNAALHRFQTESSFAPNATIGLTGERSIVE
jgi:site-specific DNA-methyltransferase (adenine-specific)